MDKSFATEVAAEMTHLWPGPDWQPRQCNQGFIDLGHTDTPSYDVWAPFGDYNVSVKYSDSDLARWGIHLLPSSPLANDDRCYTQHLHAEYAEDWRPQLKACVDGFLAKMREWVRHYAQFEPLITEELRQTMFVFERALEKARSRCAAWTGDLEYLETHLRAMGLVPVRDLTENTNKDDV